MTIYGKTRREINKTVTVTTQANPVQNTWYTMLNEAAYVQLILIGAQVATTGETLELRVTLGGYTETISFAATAAAIYKTTVSGNPTDGVILAVESGTQTRNFRHLEGRGLKVELRKTTNNGVGTITARSCYEVIK